MGLEKVDNENGLEETDLGMKDRRKPGDDMGEWQPIETAPIGQSVFAYHPMYGRFLGYKERIGETDFTQWCNWDGDKGILPPTHWMPLPPPPEDE